MSTTSSAPQLREEIRKSWQRAALSGLSPEDSLDDLAIEDVNRRSRLLEAASPVLDRISNDLDDTGYCVILADRDARLVDLRFGQRRLSERMAQDGAIRGRRFVEATTGTNTLATVHETRQPLRVSGGEHFIHAMKKFTCYGMPLIHPATHRLEGVLDITCLNADDNALLGPMLRRAVDDVQSRLLDRSRRREQFLLAAFQDAVGRHRDEAVMAFADGIALTNAKAGTLIDPVDHAVLRAVIDEERPGGAAQTTITLSSGSSAHVQWTFVQPDGGAIIRVHLPLVQAATARTPARPASRRAQRIAMLIRGESGTGKTTAAAALHPDPTILHAAALADHAQAAWLDSLRAAVADPAGLVVIENIELLPTAVARRARELLEDSGCSFVLTIAEGDTTPEHRQLAALADQLEELPPLRATPDRIPDLARELLRERDPRARFAPTALVALTGRRWPGNIRELKETVAFAADRRNGPEVLPTDLNLPKEQIIDQLTALERSERDAIHAALSRHKFNKTAVAQELRISRTTLYKKMRELRILG